MAKLKTAVITGGAQGIGKAVALRFLKEGYSVVIADSDAEAGDESLAELSALGKAVFIPTDVADEDSVRSLVRKTIEFSGGIDILINNAAILDNQPIEKLSLKNWKRVIDVNLTGVFLCVKYCVPYLKKTRGSIVNIASTRALQSEANTEAYSASKGGIVALSHALSVSLGPEVRVNCISPGWIETRDWKKRSQREEVRHSRTDELQHPAGRVGKPEDIASLAGYLCSDEAGFITGANIVVDGGMTRKMIYSE